MQQEKTIGFWGCWSLTVGIMIGSGVFLLPSVLAPYGMLSFSGWALTATGSIFMALVVARLAARTTRSGGVYAYTHDAFGNLPGFLVAWGYWAAYWIAIPAMAIAFVGYLGVFIPSLKATPLYEALCALGLIWLITIVNLRGIKEASAVQLAMTLLKLLPLLLIITFGFVAGDTDNLPPSNPGEQSFLPLLATTALLTMWAFSGLEAGTIPAGEVKNAERTIPRAIVIGTVTVAVVYIGSTLAVMLLVPAEQLMQSTAPFAEAARGLGSWGPPLVAVGAMISTAGAINGTVFVLGQIPMAVALDGLAPKVFAKRNAGGSSNFSLILSSSLASILLMSNYSKGLLSMFELLATMSTLAILVPLFVSSLAEFKYSWASKKGWAGVAMLALAYSVFTILGSGVDVILIGLILFAAGLPCYWLGKRHSPPKPTQA